jgi:cellulose synthase/poly-beta-1,6-N-acetylglucosamine synthase-like glycosyltransferase
MADSVFAWSVGLVYIAYDTALIGFVFVQTLALLRPKAAPASDLRRPTLGVLVAAHNEASVLPITLRALFAQTEPADLIVIADDGSLDETASLLSQKFGLAQPAMGTMSPPSLSHPSLRWMRLPHGGKARALNAAIATVDTELVLTVDGDTLLDPEATRAMRDAFAADQTLVAATGVLTPICSETMSGRFYQWFQTYEYIRNFLSRYAWGRMDALLLISGAFAGFRRLPVLAVGAFDPACLVEDYELIHRLRRYGVLEGLDWTTGVVGAAKALTDAPSTTAAFLRQRRRWFCGFLQTQYWYRDMVGNPRYGRLGLMMLPVKALDTLQPIYGLLAVALLAFYLVTGRLSLAAPVGGIILAKIAIDFAFHLWSIHLYRRWVDPKTSARLDRAILASLAEPFTFQILRHTGAALGWVYFLTGQSQWGKKSRLGLVEPREALDGKA